MVKNTGGNYKAKVNFGNLPGLVMPAGELQGLKTLVIPPGGFTRRGDLHGLNRYLVHEILREKKSWEQRKLLPGVGPPPGATEVAYTAYAGVG